MFDYNTIGNFPVTGLTEDLNNAIAGLAETDELTIELDVTTNKLRLKDIVAAGSGGTRTFQGDTIFTQGVTANTLNVNGVNITGDTYTTGGTYSAGTIDFNYNSGGGYQVTGLYTGQTSYVNSLNVGIGLSGNSTTGNITIVNTDPDQIVTISGGTGILTGGTYPNFTIENTLPDQVVSISGGTDIEVVGTYPNFGVNFTGTTDQIVTISGGTGILTGGTYPNFTITNTLPDQVVSISGGTNIQINGVYPNFGIDYTGQTTFDYLPISGGTVTGDTIFTSGLTANTLNINGVNITGDTYVTGGTYYTGGTIIFDYNTGGDFPVTGLTEDLNNAIAGLAETDELTIELDVLTNKIRLKDIVAAGSGGTRTFQGDTIFTSGLTATTLNVNGINITGDTYVTGGTYYTGGTIVFDYNTAGNFPVTGLTEDLNIAIAGLAETDELTIELDVSTNKIRLKDIVAPGSGGTRTFQGGIVIESGVTATTISATTYNGDGSNLTGVYPSTNPSGFTSNVGTVTSINSLTAATQTLGVGSTGTDFTINSTGSTHTFNLPTASAINRGALSSTDWTVFNNKVSTGPITGSGLTMVTSRLLGRTTSLSGSVEEISIGTGLSLSSGTLSATSSTGVFGISNSGGTYTFYSTLSAAMSAATAGQTIEMFADVTGTTTVTLKPNVILFGNGHTYTYSGNTGDVFSTSPGSGTYFFYNMNIKRSNTATSTGVIFSADGTVFGTALTFKCYNLTVTYTTTTGAAPIVTTTSFGIYGWVFDGIEVIGNSSGFLFPSVFSVNNIRNSRIENTGTGGGYSTANINGGSVIENTYVKTVSGVAILLNYTNQGDSARNCTAITTSSNGIAGGTAINCYSFSNSGIAIISNAFNCVATTVTGIAYYQSNAWNSIGTSSSTGVAVRPFFTMSSFYNCTFRSAGNATISDTNYPARFYNCSIENTWNSVSGHGVLLNGAGVEVTNCSISVTNASANCIIGAGPITVKYANNSFRGATTPININVTQGITNTHDNQGNILI